MNINQFRFLSDSNIYKYSIVKDRFCDFTLRENIRTNKSHIVWNRHRLQSASEKCIIINTFQ